MLYIDIDTGTYGDADSLRYVPDTWDLEQMSDSEIIDYGINNGARRASTVASRPGPFKYVRIVRAPEADNRAVRESSLLLNFTWHGGPYIDVMDDDASSGIPQEVINVWDYLLDAPTIDVSQSAFEAKCDEWVTGYGAEALMYDVLYNWGK